jgi:hypothetical protein
VICLPIDGPPASALAMARAFTADMTTREWHEAIFATPGCNSCHSRLEPPGFAFETFDQIGRVRHEERGEPIRTHTTISSGTDLDGRYESEADFSEAIATSPVARDCFTRAWVQSAVGRPVSNADRRLLRDVSTALETDVHEAVVALVTSDAFRLARTTATTTDTGADR